MTDADLFCERMGRAILRRFRLVMGLILFAIAVCIGGISQVESHVKPTWAKSSRVAARNVMEGRWGR